MEEETPQLRSPPGGAGRRSVNLELFPEILTEREETAGLDSGL